jgi:hypothetical protein
MKVTVPAADDVDATVAARAWRGPYEHEAVHV